jgi:hypothetical protein
MRILSVVFALLLLPVASWAQDNAGHLQKMNAFAIKPGYHMYQSNDFFDFWDIDEDDMSSFMFEVAYERKLNQIFGIELGLGYFKSDETYYPFGLSSEIDIENFYLSPTIKGYLPVCDYFYLYAGAGPDIYFTRGDYDLEGNIRGIAVDYSEDEEEFGFGGHVLGGMEFYIIPNPGPNQYDAPLGVFIEYRHSWVEVDDVDEDTIDIVNQALNEDFGPNNLDVGGSQIMAGLRWHF